MKHWRLLFTGQAERDLRDIYEYIAFTLMEVGIAQKQVARIKERISKLNEMPMRHEIYGTEPWKSRKLRFMPIDNYTVFYLVQEKQDTVIIVRIMYSGRNAEDQLK